MLSVNCVFNASLPKTWEISSWLSYRKCHMHTVVDMFLIAPECCPQHLRHQYPWKQLQCLVFRQLLDSSLS